MSGQYGSAFPVRPDFAPNQTPMFSPSPAPFSAAPSCRKRRASSSLDESNPSAPSAPWTEPKRRRPNLHNGFATMSISPRPDDDGNARAPPRQFSGHVDDNASDDGLEPTRMPADSDVAVEVLSDKHPSPTHSKRPLLPHRASSFSSTTPSDEEDYESDATFRPPQERARLRQAHHSPMQPTSVEHPEHFDLPPTIHSSPMVDTLDSPLKRKHVSLDEGNGHTSKRRRSYMDMDGDAAMDGVAPVASGPGWYEPEKDRIVITSLSSPESYAERLSRSPSPDPGPRRQYSYEEHKHLAQPGQDGFTISPSLLTHLMAAQSDPFRPDLAYNANPERGLVLYRPLGIPAAENIVKQWDQEDDGRFEEVDDDEDLRSDAPVVGVPMDIGGGQWGNGGGWGEQPQWGGGGGGGDEAMDIE